jgi:hypothetical protein
MHAEDDAPFFISTIVSFKDKKLPPLENDGTNDSDTVSESNGDADDDNNVIQSEVEQ